MNKLITEPTPTTLQGVFDRAWAWVNRPNFERCVDIGGCCVYRSPDGTNACIIGCCIPDDDYNAEIENNLIEGIKSLFFHGISAHDLSQLQTCHDLATTKEKTLGNLQHFAKMNNLTITL